MMLILHVEIKGGKGYEEICFVALSLSAMMPMAGMAQSFESGGLYYDVVGEGRSGSGRASEGFRGDV